MQDGVNVECTKEAYTLCLEKTPTFIFAHWFFNPYRCRRFINHLLTYLLTFVFLHSSYKYQPIEVKTLADNIAKKMTNLT